MAPFWRVRNKLPLLLAELTIVLVSLVVFPTGVQAQIPPSVLPFIDLKCYGITNQDGSPLPPVLFPLFVEHLNPLFLQLGVPPERVLMLDPFQLCVPVAKNGVNPPDDALKFIQYIDLKCYNIQADPP